MPALLDYPPPVEDQDPVGLLGCGKAVGDAYRGPAFREVLERPFQGPFCLGVDRRGRLVENQQPRVGHLGPGQSHQLPFTDR